jgi:uncharacterized protein YkwD
MFAPFSACGLSGQERPAKTDATASQGAPDLDRVKKQILTTTNQFRKQEQRGELKENAALSKAAQAFAEFMAKTDKYSHEADGKTPAERVAAAGYQYCLVAENIAYEYSSTDFTTDELATNFIEGWKKSPPHRKNLLDADLSDIGLGVARSSQSGKYYAVQNFGRPKSAEIEFQIANRTDATVEYDLEGKTYSLKPRYTVTHQVCRPPEVKLQWPNKKDAASADKGKVLQPAKGDHYVIRKDKNGDFTVEKE